MGETNCTVVRLVPMRVAVFRAFSQTPERDAWDRLRAWAGEPDPRAVFGFNNPNPSPERKEYGYELWLRIDPSLVLDAEIEFHDCPGGLYAMAACRLRDIAESWRALWEWVRSSEYRWRKAHELERVLNPASPEEEMVVELYLPLEGP
jgi:DNA gyrase inhibitor GyrI